MLKLMKYEFRKTRFSKLVLLGIAAVLEIVYLIALYANKSEFLVLSVSLLTFLATGGIMFIGLESVITLHRDMNTKQSYMLFMTPNSSYKILGAKVLENGVSILLAGAFFFALGALNIMLLFAKEGQLGEIWNMFQDFIHNFAPNANIDAGVVGALVFSLLTGWICSVTTAYLADVISTALLTGKKHNGLLSFLFFLVLSFIVVRLSSLLVRGVQGFETQMVVVGLIRLAFTVGMYYVTAQIMERKLSV